ncbi:MAG: BatD family protein [Ginsengibacter sp.]
MIPFLRSTFKINFFFFLFLPAIFIARNSEAQVKFSVDCPQKKIGKNDVLHIKFKVENATNVDNITPPAFKNFTIVSGPNQERSQSNINGKISGYVALGYTLAPTGIGKFTIGPATAIADRQNLTTNPITIQVVKGSVAQSQPNNPQQNLPSFPNLNFDFPSAPVSHQFDDYILKPNENVADKTAKNLFIKLNVNKKTCYVGEPIVATYQLFTRLPSETTITDVPSFNGFSVNDLDINSNSTIQKYNGRLYNVYNIRKVELYPLQSGKITLGSMTSSNKVTFVKSQYIHQRDNGGFFDMFQNFGQDAIPPEGLVDKNVTLKSDPEEITVRPLPDTNKPQDFRGAVGNFTISASLEKDKFTTDDAGTLQLTVTGKGNIQLINAPSIKWPKGIDGYDAKVKDNVDRKQVPMQGSKTFSYPFTVSKAGNYTIDSLEFSYFDPTTSTYKTIYTHALHLSVTKGKGIPHNSLADSSNSSDASNFISSRTEIIIGIILVGLVVFAILFVLMKRNKNKDELEKNIEVDDLKNEAKTLSVEKEKQNFIIPENPLIAAHEKLVEQDSAGFYHTLDASLKKYLAAKFKMPASELSKKRLNEELDNCNVSLGTSLMLTSLMDEVEINLYAPPSNVNQLNSVFEKASEVVSLLDKQVC